MRDIFRKGSMLCNLTYHIRENYHFAQPKKSRDKKPNDKKEVTAAEKEAAATEIQRFWRGKQIKQKITRNPYFSYMSLVEPADKQHMLSALMFGRNEAQIYADSKERINNPLIDITGAFYHRTSFGRGLMQDELLREFGISDDLRSEFVYIPIVNLKSIDVMDAINRHLPGAHKNE